MDKLIDVLRDFRFSDYEIRVLLCLIQEGELTASEISEKSGVPRTSVYDVIRSLESKGLVESYGKPKKFRAISAERLVNIFSQKLKEKLDVLSSSLKELEKRSKREVVEIVKGETAYGIIEEVVRDSKEIRVYALSLSDELRKILERAKGKKEIKELKKKGVTHGIIFADDRVIIFTVRDGEPHIILGSGEFAQFYRDILEHMIKFKRKVK